MGSRFVRVLMRLQEGHLGGISLWLLLCTARTAKSANLIISRRWFGIGDSLSRMAARSRFIRCQPFNNMKPLWFQFTCLRTSSRGISCWIGLLRSFLLQTPRGSDCRHSIPKIRPPPPLPAPKCIQSDTPACPKPTHSYFLYVLY